MIIVNIRSRLIKFVGLISHNFPKSLLFRVLSSTWIQAHKDMVMGGKVPTANQTSRKFVLYFIASPTSKTPFVPMLKNGFCRWFL